MSDIRQPVTVSVTIYGGIYYKVWKVPDAGTIVPQHAHSYDHITALLSGVVIVMVGDDEVRSRYAAPATIRIPAHRKHSFLTMAPNCVLACIHNADHADADGEPQVAEAHVLERED